MSMDDNEAVDIFDGENIPHETDLATEILNSMTDVELNEEGADMDDEVFSHNFQPLTTNQMNNNQDGFMRVNVPANRYTPLKNNWMQIYTPIVEHMKLNIRFDLSRKCIELQTCNLTEHPNALQKAADFCRAFCLGFELRDAIALLRLDDLYLNSFEFKDVRILRHGHFGRAVGRVAGHGGRTRYTIENATKTRIVINEKHIHFLGSFQNIRVARRAMSKLIIGTPPSKIYSQMRNVAGRNKQRF